MGEGRLGGCAGFGGVRHLWAGFCVVGVDEDFLYCVPLAFHLAWCFVMPAGWWCRLVVGQSTAVVCALVSM